MSFTGCCTFPCRVCCALLPLCTSTAFTCVGVLLPYLSHLIHHYWCGAQPLHSGVFLEMKNVNNLTGLQNRVLEILHQCQSLFLGPAPGVCSPAGPVWPWCVCGAALHSSVAELRACLTSGCSTHTELVQTQPWRLCWLLFPEEEGGFSRVYFEPFFSNAEPSNVRDSPPVCQTCAPRAGLAVSRAQERQGCPCTRVSTPTQPALPCSHGSSPSSTSMK